MTVIKNKKLKIEFNPRNKNIIVVLVWALLIALIMIKAHYLLYSRYPRFFAYGTAYSVYQPPSLEIIDMLFLLVIGLVASALVDDAKSLFYSYIASIGIAFVVAVTYATLFIWFTLDYQRFLSLIDFGWELAIYMGLLNMIWVLFPYVIGISAISVVTGSFLKTWLT